METSRNGMHRGLIEWAEDEMTPRPTNGVAKTPAAPTQPEPPDPALAMVERLADSERRAAIAEALTAALRAELDRAEQATRRLQAEADAERRAREQAEQARQAAESRLAEAREAVWRWLTRLARTPFWRLRRTLAEPPVELQGQPRLAAPGQNGLARPSQPEA
ncbi:MAG: hypothetical protein HZB16_06845 [Armatimonadetes bacterium]|nr:hypothetical protein [Armatimonadota bacterium]